MAFARPKKREPLTQEGLMSYALGALARRMRTVRDLRRLMKVRAEEGEAGETAMDAVVERLKELNYLSDERFAADYTRVRKEGEKFGRRRVQQDLMMKGVKSDVVTDALDTGYEGVDELVLAREYVARKRIQKPVDEKESARVMRRMVRAGFSIGIIFKLFKSWAVPVEGLEGVEDEDFPRF